MTTSPPDATAGPPATGPLAGLDAVPWHELHHAYHTAHDVPGQLRALRSPDPAVRGQASYALYGNIHHQGTRWQASSHAVPFLVALVDDPHTPDRVAVARLLRHVVLGDRGDDDLPFDAAAAFAAADGVTDEQEALVVTHLYSDDNDLFEHEDAAEAADAVAVRWDAQAYRAGGRHVDSYRAWLRGADRPLACAGAELLAWYPPSPQTVAALLAVPEHDGAEVRAGANLTLAHLNLAHLPDRASRVDAHLTGLLVAGAETVRVSAALALAYRLGDQLPTAALEILVDVYERRPTLELPAWDRPLLGFTARALHRLGLT